MKKLAIIMFAALVIIILTGNIKAQAEPTVKHYLKTIKDKNTTEYFVLNWVVYGIGVGLAWANTDLESREEKKIYCQPSKLALGAENYISIIDRYLEKYPYFTEKDDWHVGMILKEGLKETFPCD